MINHDKAANAFISAVLLFCIVKVAVISGSGWPSVGILLSLGIIWAPHAYFSKRQSLNCDSISYNKKKIESLTTSLNLLSVKLSEVEKLSHQVSKAQGFTNLNRKYQL